MIDPFQEPPELALRRFLDLAERDRGRYGEGEASERWVFIDRKLSRGELVDMNFYGFHGPAHVNKFFQWIRGPRYDDYFDDSAIVPLIELSATRDEAVFRRLGIAADAEMLARIGRYNAQDYLYQRLYPVPERQKIKRILDFGAGHGRMANLAFGVENSGVELLVGLDAIPASYLTQRIYYSALGCEVADYLDNPEISDFEVLRHQSQVMHIPTWRMDLLPDNYFDLVCCVQVLREIPQRVLLHAVREFQRVLRPGGALYIRDSNEMHNPNLMPQDLIVSSAGFLLEYYPRVKNMQDIHGIPRIWRKVDPEIFVTT